MLTVAATKRIEGMEPGKAIGAQAGDDYGLDLSIGHRTEKSSPILDYKAD